MEQNEIYAALPGVLLPWYEKNARDLPWRHTKEPYRVWVSEIMLQQTRVEAVIGYYERFMEAFPTVQALAEADEARVLKLWEGLGYYSRARNLQKTAKLLTETQNGAFPDTAEALEKLPGIGAYTEGAVASICFEQPAAAVDGNVLRIIMRMTADGRPIDLPQVKKEIGEALCKVYPKGHCGAFTQALMELGACVCTPKSPKCEVCPTQSFCRAYTAGNVTKYPVKRPKAAKKTEERTVLLLECNGRFAVEKRSKTGLLAGLWQFPNVPQKLDAQIAVQTAQSFHTDPKELMLETHKTHIFTHIRWEMTGYVIRCNAMSEAFTWASLAEIEHDFALPTAFRQFSDELKTL